MTNKIYRSIIQRFDDHFFFQVSLQYYDRVHVFVGVSDVYDLLSYFWHIRLRPGHLTSFWYSIKHETINQLMARKSSIVSGYLHFFQEHYALNVVLNYWVLKTTCHYCLSKKSKVGNLYCLTMFIAVSSKPVFKIGTKIQIIKLYKVIDFIQILALEFQLYFLNPINGSQIDYKILSCLKPYRQSFSH